MRISLEVRAVPRSLRTDMTTREQTTTLSTSPSSSCPLCASLDVDPCVDRGSVPVFQNARYRDPDSARAAARGRLRLAVCRRCGFSFNAGFDPDLARYDVTYENDQTMSAHFVAHVASVARRALALVSDVPNPTVLEVGCGQGAFLRQLQATSGGRIGRALGFDPSLRAPVTEATLRLDARVFDESAARDLKGAADLAILRHVIEHIHRPVDLLASLRTALAPGGGKILVETPCFEWILGHHAWHDIFYEHCNYSTADTLARLMRRAGFANVSVERVFGGQYLLASADTGEDQGRDALPRSDGVDVAARAAAFGRTFDAYAAHWRARLAGPAPLAIWGAGAKGVTFASIIQDAAPLRGLIDIDPKKQGTYAALTGLPILSPARAVEQGVQRVVVMNPNYADEVDATVASLGGHLEIIVMDRNA